MVVYYSMFYVVASILFLAGHIKMSKTAKKATYIVACILLVAVAGLRYYVGTDYAQYVLNYPKYLNRELSFTSQPALTIVARLAAIIKNDYATWFFLMSVITIVPVIVAIIKYSTSIGMSIVMYILLGCWHYSFNLVKQSAAAAILLLGFAAIRDRKLIIWFVYCAVASMFHITALMMFPVYFLVNAKITKKKVIMLIAIGGIVMVSYDYLLSIVDALKQGEGLVGRNTATLNNSVSILRILVNCAPMALCAVFWKKYDAEDRTFACLFNLSLFNAVINVGSMNSIYLNRFCCYTNIYNALFIPLLFKPLKGWRKWTVPVILVLYFAFWSYDLYKGSSTVVFHWIFER